MASCRRPNLPTIRDRKAQVGDAGLEVLHEAAAEDIA